jgi:hypothetical protein
VTDDKRDAAKGAELLLSAIIFQQYFTIESDSSENDVLEVIRFRWSRVLLL